MKTRTWNYIIAVPETDPNWDWVQRGSRLRETRRMQKVSPGYPEVNSSWRKSFKREPNQRRCCWHHKQKQRRMLSITLWNLSYWCQKFYQGVCGRLVHEWWCWTHRCSRLLLKDPNYDTRSAEDRPNLGKRFSHNFINDGGSGVRGEWDASRWTYAHMSCSALQLRQWGTALEQLSEELVADEGRRGDQLRIQWNCSQRIESWSTSKHR